MRKITFIVLIFLLIINCSNKKELSNTKKVINEYFRMMSEGNYEKALDYISEKDKDIFKNKYTFNKIINEFTATYYKLTIWEIKDVKIYKNEAQATLYFKTPNIGELFGKAIVGKLSLAYGLTYDSNSELLLDNIYKDVYREAIIKLNNGNFDYIYVEEKIKLLRENNEWKIFLNIKQSEDIKNIILEAAHLFGEEKYIEAGKKLKPIFTIDKDNEIAKNLLKRIEKKLKNKNSQSHLNKSSP